MLNDHNLATPLNGNLNMQAYIEVLREELEAIDPMRLFLYLFDTVDASLLDYLAEQFDMLGYNGWVLAQNDQQKRELLKSAFELHAMKGTIGGIREVVKRLGFPDIIIHERTGAPVGAANPWAYFTVQYVIPSDRPIDAVQINNLLGLISKYKNARSVLADFNFLLPEKDYLQMKGRVYFKVINAATNAVISEETVDNWIHPKHVEFLFENIRYKTETEITTMNDYRFKQIMFGTSGATQQPSQSGPDFTITDEYVKLLSDNPDPVGVGQDKSLIGSGGSTVDRIWLRHFFTLDAGEMNGKTIREAALVLVDRYTGSPGDDILFSRVVRSPVVKTSAIRIEGHWTLYMYPNTKPTTGPEIDT